MASNTNKRTLSGESVHAAEARTKATLDERDEKSIIRVRVFRLFFVSVLALYTVFGVAMHGER